MALSPRSDRATALSLPPVRRMDVSVLNPVRLWIALRRAGMIFCDIPLRGFGVDQLNSIPPLMSTLAPVMKAPSLQARNSTRLATSIAKP